MSPSSYQPPRAGRLSALRYTWYRLLRLTERFDLRLPIDLTFGNALMALLIPGHGFLLARKPGLARIARWAWPALLMGYLICLGTTAANVAGGLMVAIHASGFASFLLRFMEGDTIPRRLLLSLLVVGLYAGLIYAPAQQYLINHWWMPVQVQGHRILVNTRIAPADVRVGDEVFYAMPEMGIGQFALRSGMGRGEVLAVGGDQIRFSPAACFINGNPLAPLPEMPASGEMIVPENHWFIWPEFAINGRNTAGNPTVQGIYLSQSMVPFPALKGRAVQRWMGIKQ